MSTGQEGLYDELTGFADCMRTQTPVDEIIQELQESGPSGFDPRPSLLELAQPTLWLFAGNDLSHPTDLAVINLREIEDIAPKPWTIVVVPGANHDFVDGGGICQTDGPMADGLTPLGAWLADVVLR